MTDKPNLAQEEVSDEHVASLEPNYIGVFWWLVALTIAEIALAASPTGPMFPKMAQGIMLVLLALGKAGFVALYFMHLKFERPALGIIALSPLVICALLIIGLLPDIAGTPHKSQDKKTAQVQTVEQSVHSENTAEVEQQ